MRPQRASQLQPRATSQDPTANGQENQRVRMMTQRQGPAPVRRRSSDRRPIRVASGATVVISALLRWPLLPEAVSTKTEYTNDTKLVDVRSQDAF